MQVRMQMHPADPRNFPMRRGKAERRRQQGSDREPVRKEEDAEPIDAERRAAGSEDQHHIDPAAPLVSGRAFRAHQHDCRRHERGQARGQMDPAKRHEVEFIERLNAL
jgi:hypothetical protein